MTAPVLITGGAGSVGRQLTGMFLEAELDHDLNLMDCLMIGDSYDDMQAGEMLGMDTMLVLTGRGQDAMKNFSEYEMPTFIVQDLKQGAEKLCL